MKNFIAKVLTAAFSIVLFSCSDLDILPLSQGSSEDWYTSKQELEMSLNDTYRMEFWKWAVDNPDVDNKWDDDWVFRNGVSAIVAGTLNGQNADVKSVWTSWYTVIARVNLLLSISEIWGQGFRSMLGQRFRRILGHFPSAIIVD